MNSDTVPKARIQDVVASLSHVKLRQTVRVLRATAMAAQALGYKELAAELNAVLYASTKQGGFASPLHSKPEHESVDACYEAVDRVQDVFGATSVHNMSVLADDPYFDNRITARNELIT